MRRYSWRFLFLAFAVFGLALSAHSSASAATPTDGFNVVTSPLPIKITTPPGKTVTTQLRVKNEGDQSEEINVGLMKFSVSGQDGTPDLYNLSPKDTYSSWVSFSPQQFNADPGIWYTVTMTINIPKDASLGYYMAVTFSRASQTGVTGAANLKGAAATLILLNVDNGNESRKVNLVDFTTTQKLYEYLPVTFNIRLHNSGNIYIAPVGNIFIQRGNKALSSIDFNDAGGSILPNSNRLYNVTWSDGFPVYVNKLVNGVPVRDSSGNNKETLKWDFSQASKFRFGEYTAKLLVVYDNGTSDVPLEAAVSFWVLPWKLMLLGLLIIGLVAFSLWSIFRSVFKNTSRGVSKYRHGRR